VDADQCFAKLPSTDVTLNIAVYYYSVQIATHLRWCSDDEDQTLSRIYRTSPAGLSSAIVSYISRALSVETEMSASVHQMALRLMHFNGRLIELTQAQALRKLDRGKLGFAAS